jgi:hypothetical protein
MANSHPPCRSIKTVINIVNPFELSWTNCNNLMTKDICGLYYISLMIVIYDRIDSGQYYRTIIMIISYATNITLAFSSVVNYDRK